MLSGSVDSMMPKESQGFPIFEGHRLVSLPKTKNCVVCQANRVKTKSGWGVKTRQICSLCDVPLCSYRTERNCYYIYHANRQILDQFNEAKIQMNDQD